ncbi:MAG TPA: GNAT family N-acetyltransferase [Pyrinomonadaceae bacterium]|nr:GNAT family N-acetyltransferase [Pyrinomonadaceae bacterium]
MSPTVTPADEGDEDLLVELMREFYAVEHLRFDDEASRRALAMLLGSRAYGVVYVIRAGEETAGYLVLTFGFSLEFHGRDALVDELYVREAFRGRGLGRAALRAAEALCRDEGVKAIHLEIDRTNVRAQGLYRGEGYVDHDRYLWTKWLA